MEPMKTFELHSEFTPKGDQVEAIGALTASLEGGNPHQVLMGVTGSGKTFTVANVIARLRLCATNSLFQRRDVIVVASVSCIYGIGAPETYYSMSFRLAKGQAISRKKIVESLVGMQYERQEDDFKRGTFRLRGGVTDVFPSHG